MNERTDERRDDITVQDDPAAGRFEAHVDGQVAVLTYRLSAGKIFLDHTEVPGSLRGRGIADRLARAALESARNRGLTVVPLCPFVRAYLRKHPEYRSLVSKA